MTGWLFTITAPYPVTHACPHLGFARHTASYPSSAFSSQLRAGFSHSFLRLFLEVGERKGISFLYGAKWRRVNSFATQEPRTFDAGLHL